MTETAGAVDPVVLEPLDGVLRALELESLGGDRSCQRLLPGLEDDVLESYEEHHIADVLCGACHHDSK